MKASSGKRNILIVAYPLLLNLDRSYLNAERFNLLNELSSIIRGLPELPKIDKTIVFNYSSDEIEFPAGYNIEVKRIDDLEWHKEYLVNLIKNNNVFYHCEFINGKLANALKFEGGFNEITGFYINNPDLLLPRAGFTEKIYDNHTFYEICELQGNLVNNFIRDINQDDSSTGDFDALITESLHHFLKEFYPDFYTQFTNPNLWIVLKGNDPVLIKFLIKYLYSSNTQVYWNDLSEAKLESLPDSDVYVFYSFEKLSVMEQNIQLNSFINRLNHRLKKVIITGNPDKITTSGFKNFTEIGIPVEEIVETHLTRWFYYLLLDQKKIEEAFFRASGEIIENNLLASIFPRISSLTKLSKIPAILKNRNLANTLFQKSLMYDLYRYSKKISGIKDEDILLSSFKELLINIKKEVITLNDSTETVFDKDFSYTPNAKELLSHPEIPDFLDALFHYFGEEKAFILISNNLEKAKQLSPNRMIFRGEYWEICYQGNGPMCIYDYEGMNFIAYLLSLPEGKYSCLDIWLKVRGEEKKEEKKEKEEKKGKEEDKEHLDEMKAMRNIREYIKRCQENINAAEDKLPVFINSKKDSFSEYIKSILDFSEAKENITITVQNINPEIHWNIVFPNPTSPKAAKIKHKKRPNTSQSKNKRNSQSASKKKNKKK